MNEIENIVIVCTWAESLGGSVKVAIKNAVGMAGKGYNVIYFAAVGPVADELRKSNVHVVCIGSQDIKDDSNRFRGIVNGLWNSKAANQFADVLKKLDPKTTIVHYHGWNRGLSTSLFHITKRLKFKTVITLHDYFSVCPNGAFCDFQKIKLCTCEPMSLKCLVTNCDKKNYAQKLYRVIRQAIQDRYVRYNKDINFIYISDLNGRVVKQYVKSNRFYRVNNPANAVTQRACQSSSSKMFLYVGRISDEKGTDLFCEAVSSVMQEHPEVCAAVLGAGNLFDTLKEKYPKILFTGWVGKEQVKEYMERARCLVLPSRWYEGAPLTIIEAMGSGLPCIVSDCTTVAETITDGVSGFVFENGKVNVLKAKIEQALDDKLIDEIQNNIRNSIDPNANSLETHIKRLEEVYNQILNSD